MKPMIATLAASILALVGSQASAQEFTANYKITMTQTATHPYGVGAQKFADLLKERTKGRITATVYTDSQLAKGEREMIEALQHGHDRHLCRLDRAGRQLQPVDGHPRHSVPVP